MVIASNALRLISTTVPGRFNHGTVLIFIIVVLEGSVRKWLDQSLGAALVIIRDVACAYLFWRALNESSHRLGLLREVYFVYAAAVIFWGGLQLIINQTSPILYFIGLRYWLLYIGFALFAATRMNDDECVACAQTLVVLLILSTPLSILQYLSPPTSPINIQIDTADDDIFRVAGDTVRTSGFFTFTTAYALFGACVAPIVLCNEICGKPVFRSAAFRALSVVLLITYVMVSGSRTSIINLCLMVTIYVVGTLLISRDRHAIRAALGTLIMLVLGLAVVALFLSETFWNLQDRFATASETEDIGERFLSTILGEPELRDGIGWLGAGLGMGTNIASYYMSGQRVFALAETEPARLLLEAGLLGWGLIGLKLAFICWAGFHALQVSLNRKTPTAIVYFFSASVSLMTWPATGQLSVNALMPITILLFLLSISPAFIQSKNVGFIKTKDSL